MFESAPGDSSVSTLTGGVTEPDSASHTCIKRHKDELISGLLESHLSHIQLLQCELNLFKQGGVRGIQQLMQNLENTAKEKYN